MLCRRFLALSCSLVVGLSSTALAQQVTQQPTRPAAAQPQRPTPEPMQLSVELEQVLKVWENRSSEVNTLQGEHKRYVYQPVVGLEIHANGQFFFAAPDKGRIDIEPIEIPEGAVGKRLGIGGQPLRVKSADSEKWVCDGTQILGLSEPLGVKQYSRVEIPPQARGENLTDGPLPFLFGVSAEKLKARYRMKLGDKHTWQPATGDGMVHVVAYPTRRQDAQNWQEAQVLLDGKYFLPKAIKFKDGLGPQASETVFVFNQQTLSANQSWKASGMRQLIPVGFNPFKPSLRGYKLIEDRKVTANTGQ